MKLYVWNRESEKIYLSSIAPTRLSLAHQIGSKTFYLKNQLYHVNNVCAEPSSGSAVTGAVTGSLIGALAGPIGILIAGGLGTLIGGGVQEEENQKANKFNESLA